MMQVRKVNVVQGYVLAKGTWASSARTVLLSYVSFIVILVANPSTFQRGRPMHELLEHHIASR